MSGEEKKLEMKNIEPKVEGTETPMNVTIHVKKPTNLDPSVRGEQRQVVKDLLDPEKALDFSLIPDLDDIQIAQLIDGLKPENLPLVLRKFHSVSAVRNAKLRSNLTFEHISYKKGADTYLSGVSGYVKANRMVCVLGAPDSGITTLIKTLAGRASLDAQVSGTIFLDGQPIDEGFGQHVGYIPKDDLHYPTLTVRETVRMSARMRVGEILDVHQKVIVEIILKFLGLDGHIANTIVGDDTIRGISGGQKRRVSIATEIAAQHQIILADLLTNGLDSKTSYDLVKQMADVAHTKDERNAFMISLVQPAPELFDLFDDLLLMSKGRSLYFGPVKRGMKYPIMEFLNEHGFIKPQGKSIPDFLAEISYNPVRFHVTRMIKRTMSDLTETEGTLDEVVEIKVEGPSGEEKIEEKKEEHFENGAVADAKEAKAEHNPYYMNVGKPHTVKTLKAALDNYIKSGDKRIVATGESVVGESQMIAGGRKSIVESKVFEGESAVEAKVLMKSEARLKRQNSSALDLDHVPVARLVTGEAYTTNDNEREVGFAYLLQSYKYSDTYFKLGLKLFTEFEPRMPWDKDGESAGKFSTPFYYQAFECLKREWIIHIRDRSTLLGKLGEKVFVALILGTVFLNLNDKQRGADARVGLIFIIILNFAMGASAEIPSIMQKKRIYFSQEASGYYHGYAFLLAQQLIFIPFTVVELFLFLIIVYGMSGLEGGVGGEEFWYMFAVVLFSVIISSTWALFIVGIAPNTTSAVALFPVTVVLKMIVCGYMISPDNIPVYWEWMHLISFLTYGFRGLMINEFFDLSLSCESEELEPDTSVDNFNTPPPNGFGGNQVCPFTTGRGYLVRYDMEEWPKQEKYTCLLYLFVFIIIYHIFATFSLVFLPHELGDQEEVPKFDVQDADPNLLDESTEDTKQNAVSYIEWSNLDYRVPNRKDPKEKIILLNQVQGFARPGDMIALMGPSGAGKSTLLDVIAGKKTSGWIEGQRLVNGEEMDEFFPRIAGYVEQFDTLIELATVEETVMFSAQLRLTASIEECQKEAEHAMKSVRIAHVRDRIIGNIETGGISPELRKKLAIAVELVARPTILFLDEPTTGLDSVSAMAVVDTISDLTKRGLAVICTIHQPSSELFSRFGRILILQPTKSGGRVSYFGEVKNVIPYCHKNNLGEITKDRNIADFALEALGSTHQATGRDPADVFLESVECKELKSQLSQGVFPKNEKVKIPKFDASYATGFTKQFEVVLKRSIQTTIRDKDTIIAQFMSVIIMGFIEGTLFWQMGTDQNGVVNRISLMFLIVVFVFFTGAYKIPLIVSQRASVFRETTSNMYKAWVLYISMMIADAMLFVPRAFVFTFFVYFLSGLSLEDNGTSFWAFLFMNVLIFFFSLTLAETFAVITPNEKLGQAYHSTFLTVMTLFAGFLIRKENIPPWWIWLFYGNVVRYPLNFLYENELDGLDVNCINNKGAIPVLVAENGSYNSTEGTVFCSPANLNDPNCFQFACPIEEGNDIMDTYGIDEGIGVYAGVTVALLVGFKLFNSWAFTNLNWVDK